MLTTMVGREGHIKIAVLLPVPYRKGRNRVQTKTRYHHCRCKPSTRRDGQEPHKQYEQIHRPKKRIRDINAANHIQLRVHGREGSTVAKLLSQIRPRHRGLLVFRVISHPSLTENGSNSIIPTCNCLQPSKRVNCSVPPSRHVPTGVLS